MKYTENRDLDQILSIHGSKGRRRGLKVGVACLLVLAVVVLVWRAFYAKTNRRALQYKTQKVTRGDLTITVTATGNLQPLNQVDVGVEVSGTIESIEVDYNDHVRAGQVLARLDTSKLEAQVLQAKAVLEAARAKVLKARAKVKQAQSKLSQMKRARELSGGRVPSQAEMDVAEANLLGAQADLAMAEADVAQAEATLRVRETDLSKAVIRSPISGIVLSRHVEAGQTVAASLQTPILFTLAEDLKEMELHVDVDEADVGRLRRGQHATFTVDAYPNRQFPATVTEVRFSPKTVQGVVTYETVLRVDNSDLSLRPGMTATTDIVVKQVKDAMLVPNAALRFRPPRIRVTSKRKRRSLLSFLLPRPPKRPPSEKQKRIFPVHGKQVVWRLRKGRPTPLPIVTGVSDGRMTEILSGKVKPGMKVLTDVVIPRR